MDLEFRGTAEERRTQAEVVLMRMHRDLYGNGTPGLLPRMGDFMTRHDALEKERERVQNERHEENKHRLDDISAKTTRKSLWVAVASLAVTAAGVAIAVLAIWVTVRLAHQSSGHIIQMFSQSPSIMTLNSSLPEVH